MCPLNGRQKPVQIRLSWKRIEPGMKSEFRAILARNWNPYASGGCCGMDEPGNLLEREAIRKMLPTFGVGYES
jgi:hypothetical protein